MKVEEIMKYLPHRYPMLLVDRVLEISERKFCKCLKNVTINEAFFQGHYPGRPIMPGVLQIEAMAQSAAVVLLSDPEFNGLIPVIGGINNVKFKKQVVPGDQLIMSCELVKLKGRVGIVHCEARVDQELASKMEMTFMLVEPEN